MPSGYSVAGRQPQLVEVIGGVADLTNHRDQFGGGRSALACVLGHRECIAQRPETILQMRQLVARHNQGIGIQPDGVGFAACFVGALSVRRPAKQSRSAGAELLEIPPTPGASNPVGRICSLAGAIRHADESTCATGSKRGGALGQLLHISGLSSCDESIQLERGRARPRARQHLDRYQPSESDFVPTHPAADPAPGHSRVESLRSWVVKPGYFVRQTG